MPKKIRPIGYLVNNNGYRIESASGCGYCNGSVLPIAYKNAMYVLKDNKRRHHLETKAKVYAIIPWPISRRKK